MTSGTRECAGSPSARPTSPTPSIVLYPPGVDPGITDDERRTIAEMMAKGTYATIVLATKDLDGALRAGAGHRRRGHPGTHRPAVRHPRLRLPATPPATTSASTRSTDSALGSRPAAPPRCRAARCRAAGRRARAADWSSAARPGRPRPAARDTRRSLVAMVSGSPRKNAPSGPLVASNWPRVGGGKPRSRETEVNI